MEEHEEIYFKTVGFSKIDKKVYGKKAETELSEINKYTEANKINPDICNLTIAGQIVENTNTLFCFYKKTLYKNIEAEICLNLES